MITLKKLLLALGCITLIAAVPACHKCCKKECAPCAAPACVDKEIAVDEDVVSYDEDIIDGEEVIVYEEASCQNGACKRMNRQEDGEMYNKEY